MSTENSQKVKYILQRMKYALGFPSDTALAEYLGVKPSTISTWRMRESLNYGLIISKKENINLC